MTHYIWKDGKKFFFDSTNDYVGFRRRLTLLKKVHPRLKYKFRIRSIGRRTEFDLFVRKWGR